MDRKGAANAGGGNPGREDRVIGRMEHAVGEAQQRHRQQQARIGRRKAKTDKSHRAGDESEHQHPPRADAVDEEPDRQLRADRQDIGDGQGKAELDKANAELRH